MKGEGVVPLSLVTGQNAFGTSAPRPLEQVYKADIEQRCE
jgi:hypothetical protein